MWLDQWCVVLAARPEESLFVFLSHALVLYLSWEGRKEDRRGESREVTKTRNHHRSKINMR